MTRKDYEAVAEVLRVVWCQLGVYESQEAIVWGLANGLADLFARDNGRFDRARFVRAWRRPVN